MPLFPLPPFPRHSKKPHLTRPGSGLGEEVRFFRTQVANALDAMTLAMAQPAANPQGGAYGLVAADIGAVVFATGAGAQAFTLPDLSAALVKAPGTALILTIQCTGNATHVTITPAGTVQIDNAGVGVAFDGGTGRKRISLVSKDGLNWFSGA